MDSAPVYTHIGTQGSWRDRLKEFDVLKSVNTYL
jgi:hypothetical protein